MEAPRKVPRFQSLIPTSDISARMPPSPWLSARMTNTQYFSDTVTIRAQTISDRLSSATAPVSLPPTAPTTVCKV